MQLGKSDPRSRIESEGTERAVSPVIGVILMVAITVVLAGVIGVMVFGLADDLGESQPTASLSFSANDGGEELNISHSSGDTLTNLENDYSLLIDGTVNDTVTYTSDNISPGETIGTNEEVGTENETITVALRHEGSDSIIQEEDVDF